MLDLSLVYIASSAYGKLCLRPTRKHVIFQEQPLAGYSIHSRNSIAFSAKPRATEVNSFPPRIRSFPNRVSKILLTAGTNEEPSVRKTISTSFGKLVTSSGFLQGEVSIVIRKAMCESAFGTWRVSPLKEIGPIHSHDC
jgi:hypothetical protein